QGWGSTGFSNTNVAALTNGDMLPFIISVACNNGDYDQGTCFGEAWLRQPEGGAIMFLGGSISQPWAPPMRGQDYFMDVLIGGYDYSQYPGQNGITTTEQRTTLGSIVFNGLTLMCTESGSSSDWETAQTWIFFGDPSLQARTAPPAEISLSNSLIMVGIPFTTIISDNGGVVPNAMVAISQDGQYFRGITNEDGLVTIDHTLNPGAARLVVTAFNKTTIYEDVNVIPPDGPYVTIATVQINDAAGNGDGQLDYGEIVYLTIGLTNVGTGNATDVSAVISSENEFIAILDATATYGVIPAGDTIWVSDGYSIKADEAIPDMLKILFSLEATGSTRETWSSNFYIWSHAPVLLFSSYMIDDAAGNNNGKLDPGETVTIQVETFNAGSSAAFSVAGLLSTSSPFITVTSGAMPYGDLPAGEAEWQYYEITIDAEAPSGELAAFAFQITADMNISGYGEFIEYIGQIPVLLVDWDGNHNSPDAMAQCLENLAVGFDRVIELPEDLNLYSSVFVCLGTYPDNYVLTDAEGLLLAGYLENGGNIYMEGADTWYYDQLWSSNPLHPMFNITGLADGTSDLAVQYGQTGSIAEEMMYPFSGENSYIDHIEPIPPAMMMFMNSQPVYGTAVSYDAVSYRTIGMSFEFGGLTNSDHNKDDLMIRFLDFFGIQGVWTTVKERTPDNTLNASVYPNPVRNTPVIRFTNESESRVSINLYTINGQLAATIFDGLLPQGNQEIRWNGLSNGHRLSPGMYFLRIGNIQEVSTLKLIVTE
ncbi:MAG: T9SS type A sorting domain-containing protein, partial [Bacteroidales bacterium]|nr:T9SS type A sorting domain-containing protein [Bacteroidales bacterium]